jgi:hypothetical protein
MATDAAIERRANVLIGWYSDGQYRRRVELDIELRDKELPTTPGDAPDNPAHAVELGISGTSGRARKRDGAFIMERFDGDETGDPLDASGGQIVDELERVTEFAAGWDTGRRDELVKVWRAWHLNGMNPGCQHQRAAEWDRRPIDPSKPLGTYGLHFKGQRSPTWNMLTWVRRDEHPDGLLSEPCPECGYRFGSAWLYEPIPADVLEFVRSIIRA